MAPEKLWTAIPVGAAAPVWALGTLLISVPLPKKQVREELLRSLNNWHKFLLICDHVLPQKDSLRLVFRKPLSFISCRGGRHFFEQGKYHLTLTGFHALFHPPPASPLSIKEWTLGSAFELMSSRVASSFSCDGCCFAANAAALSQWRQRLSVTLLRFPLRLHASFFFGLDHSGQEDGDMRFPI